MPRKRSHYLHHDAGNAEPGGVVADDAFNPISELICDAIKDGCDAVFLDLHSANWKLAEV